jgi:hypothetical protein
LLPSTLPAVPLDVAVTEAAATLAGPLALHGQTWHPMDPDAQASAGAV